MFSCADQKKNSKGGGGPKDNSVCRWGGGVKVYICVLTSRRKTENKNFAPKMGKGGQGLSFL